LFQELYLAVTILKDTFRLVTRLPGCTMRVVHLRPVDLKFFIPPGCTIQRKHVHPGTSLIVFNKDIGIVHHSLLCTFGSARH